MLQCKTKWKKKKLGNLGYTYSGLKNKTIDDFGSGKDFIPYMNIYKNSIIKIDKFEQVKIGLNEHQNQVQSGDVFFTTSSETPEEVGLTSVLIDRIDKPLYLNSFCFGFRLNDNNEFNNTFLAYLLRGESVRLQISKMAQGSTRYNLSKTQLLNKLNLYYPNDKNEQQKIADILSTCDKVIEKTEETIEKYKQIKAGLMQDLFTRGLDENGTLRPTYAQSPDLYKYSEELDRHIPKEWDAKRLDGIATILSGKDYKGNPKGNYNIPIYGTGGIMGYTTIPLYSGPAILTGRKGSINTPYYVEGNFWNVDTIFCLKMLEDNDALWFYYQIYITDMTKYNEATGVPSTTTKTLNKILFAVPKPPEQMKIAESIIKFDKKIEVEEKYLNKYKQIKQGLMKRLLTPPADAEIVEE